MTSAAGDSTHLLVVCAPPHPCRLALGSCRHTKIGSQLAKGISGGQAKRTNIGIALITNPRVLFLVRGEAGMFKGGFTEEL